MIAFLQRANVPVLRIHHPAVPLDGDMPERRPLGWRWAFVGLGVLVVSTPLGLLAPGGAFGEDSPGALDLGRYNLGAMPTGLARWSSFWNHTLLGGYGFDSGNHPNVGYIISAVVGMAVISIAVFAVLLVVRYVGLVRAPDSPS